MVYSLALNIQRETDMRLRATIKTWQLLTALAKKNKRTMIAQLELIMVEAAAAQKVTV